MTAIPKQTGSFVVVKLDQTNQGVTEVQSRRECQGAGGAVRSGWPVNQ